MNGSIGAGLSLVVGSWSIHVHCLPWKATLVGNIDKLKISQVGPFIANLFPDGVGDEPFGRTTNLSKAATSPTITMITASTKTTSWWSDISEKLGLTHPAATTAQGIGTAHRIALGDPAAIVTPKSLSHLIISIISKHQF